MKCALSALVLALSALGVSPAFGQAVWYVDDSAVGVADGSSWADAFPDLELALVAAVPGDSIWVAEGLYKPTRSLTPVGAPSTDKRLATFRIPEGVSVYGAFKPGDTSVASRSGSIDNTILSGEIQDPTIKTDNSHYVVSFYDTNQTATGRARLDGFLISDGYWSRTNAGGAGVSILGKKIGTDPFDWKAEIDLANLIVKGNTSTRDGGGLWAQYLSGTIEDCVFSDNAASRRGGGAEIRILALAQQEFVMKRCEFVNNTATHGGGLSAVDSLIATLPSGQVLGVTQTFASCTFRSNTASSFGGGVYSRLFNNVPASSPLFFSGCLWHDNAADLGGAMFIDTEFLSTVLGGAWVDVHESTIADNSALTEGGAVLVDMSTVSPNAADLDLFNTIVWNNTDPLGQAISGQFESSYSNIQGGTGNPGDIDADPLFVDAAAGDYRLTPASPCVDAGDSGAVFADRADLDDDGDTSESTPLDLAGAGRLVNAVAEDTGLGCPVVDMGAFEETDVCIADRVADCQLDFFDVSDYMQAYAAGDSSADIDGDGTVTATDLSLYLALYNAGCS